MEEKISIEFTGKEFDEIMMYTDELGSETVQAAIMNAVRIASEGQK